MKREELIAIMAAIIFAGANPSGSASAESAIQAAEAILTTIKEKKRGR